MTAIWLLSTRGRPDACQEVLDACKATGMTSPGVVYVDETVDEYRGVRLPKNWTAHFEPVWGSLQASMGWAYRTYPRASQYGWLADDTVPRSDRWDRELEKAAGDWCISYARDLWLSESAFFEPELEDGTNLSAGLCWGGSLVREAGWWALPGVRQAGIDTAWTAIVAPLDLARYTRDVVVEHKHYRTGKRAEDAGDSWVRHGVAYVEADIRARNEWVWSPAYRELLERLVVKAKLPPTERRLRRMRQVMRDSIANEHWFTGVPAARIQNAMDSL